MSGMRSARRRRQAGSAPGERLILLAMAALLVTLIAVAFLRSPAAGIALLALAVAAGAAVLAFGWHRDRREESRRAQRCLETLARAAAGHQAAIEAAFVGEGGTAAFGVAGAAGRLYYAHGLPLRVEEMAFADIQSAFARLEPRRGWRLEARARPGREGARVAHGLWTGRREDADAWVAALAPHVGERVKRLMQADASGEGAAAPRGASARPAGDSADRGGLAP